MTFRKRDRLSDSSNYYSTLEYEQVGNSILEPYDHIPSREALLAGDYTSLRHLYDTHSATTDSDHIIAVLLQSDEYSGVSYLSSTDCSLLPSTLASPSISTQQTLEQQQQQQQQQVHPLAQPNKSNHLLNFYDAEIQAIKKFIKQTDSCKLGNYSVDQSIEVIFSDVQLESRLEVLIKHIAFTHLDATTASGESGGAGGDRSTTELMHLLEHSFKLIQFCDSIDLRGEKYQATLKRFRTKLITLLSSQCELIKNATNLFVCLLSSDYPGMVDSFFRIRTNEKWSVLKNVVFYAFKFAMLNFSHFLDADANDEAATGEEEFDEKGVLLSSTFNQLFYSIFNYVKYHLSR